jgi:hypothetical protein
MLQNLSVYVPDIDKEVIVWKGDSIYALLANATRTIQRLLDSSYSGTGKDPSNGKFLNDNRLDD